LSLLSLQGTVFFPLPDGTGLLYNMSGTADPPKPNSRITRDVPCKTPYTEILSVYNWLKHPQRSVLLASFSMPNNLYHWVMSFWSYLPVI